MRHDSGFPVYLKPEVMVVGVERAGQSTVLRAYNLPSLKQRWEHDLGGRVERWNGAIVFSRHLIVSSTLRPRAASAEGGNSPFGAARADLRMLHLPSGGLDLSRTVEESGWSVGPPATDGRNLYLGVSHWLHAVNIATLEPHWAVYDGGNAWPMAVASRLIVKGWLHDLRVLNVADRGASQWSAGAPREFRHCVTVGPGEVTVVVESSSARFLTDGRQAWRSDVLAADSAGAGRLVFVAGERVGGGRGGFYALDGATGRVRWSYERRSPRGAAVIVANGGVFGLDQEGVLTRFGPARRGSTGAPLPPIGLRVVPPPLPFGAIPRGAAGGLRIYEVHPDDGGVGHSVWPNYMIAVNPRGYVAWLYPRKVVVPGSGASDEEVARGYESLRFVTPAPAAGRVVALDHRGRLVGVRARDGRRMWRTPPLVSGEQVGIEVKGAKCRILYRGANASSWRNAGTGRELRGR
jgi:outer membrane protein assembly factor BamB